MAVMMTPKRALELVEVLRRVPCGQAYIDEVSEVVAFLTAWAAEDTLKTAPLDSVFAGPCHIRLGDVTAQAPTAEIATALFATALEARAANSARVGADSTEGAETGDSKRV